jgi:hypothetical protein
MNIRSVKVDQLAQRLARLTGEDVETVLERAIEERLSRIAPLTAIDRKAALNSFFEAGVPDARSGSPVNERDCEL